MNRIVSLLRRRGFLRTHAASIFLVGLVLFGVSLLFLALLAQDVEPTPVAAPQVRVENGTATQTYVVVMSESAVLRGSYSFPKAPGDALILDCINYERLLLGLPFAAPPLVARDVMMGSISLEYSELYRSLQRTASEIEQEDPARAEERAVRDLLFESRYCPATYVLFSWETGNLSWQDNAPSVALETRTYPLDTEAGGLLMFLAVVGAGLTLTGGLSWGSQRGLGGYAPARSSAEQGESTAETLHRLAENTGHWLERTRRYLLLSGVLGIFLWYPILVPWAYRTGREASLGEASGLALAISVVVFLLVLTFIWGRAYLQLDRELADWRERMARLQRREQELLDSLERDG